MYQPLQRHATDKHSAELGVLIASIGVGLIPVTIALNLATDEVATAVREALRKGHG